MLYIFQCIIAVVGGEDLLCIHALGGEDLKILRYGVCTSFLENALRPWLQPSAAAVVVPTTTLRIFHKPSISFRLPGSVSHPLILVRIHVHIRTYAQPPFNT